MQKNIFLVRKKFFLRILLHQTQEKNYANNRQS